MKNTIVRFSTISTSCLQFSAEQSSAIDIWHEVKKISELLSTDMKVYSLCLSAILWEQVYINKTQRFQMDIRNILSADINPGYNFH